MIRIIYLITVSPNPVRVCVYIVGLSGAVGILSGVMLSKWVFFSIFLIFLGGIIVIFIYICSLSINEKMVLPKLSKLTVGSFFLFFSLVDLETSINSSLNSLVQFYSVSWSPILTFLVFYLVVVLLAVVKIVQNFKGAVSKMW